ncbi:MAG: cytochrome c, partial [Candidatus Tectomicrobia bacterium]|nr:cytochrome c [Candidatus Tectomicrobia bacterium]
SSDAYRKAKQKFPGVTAAWGRSLATKLNCAGCHDLPLPPGKRVGPALTYEGSRVREGWLLSFLKNPGTIKPEYAILGTDARMPNFWLSDEEATALTKYIKKALIDGGSEDLLKGKIGHPLEEGETLFEEKKCNNCHRIGVKAGGIGPILTEAGNRLNVGWIFRFILNPKFYLPTTKMPNLGLTDEEAQAIAVYVISHK